VTVIELWPNRSWIAFGWAPNSIKSAAHECLLWRILHNRHYAVISTSSIEGVAAVGVVRGGHVADGGWA
jgi:hypothetical protein